MAKAFAREIKENTLHFHSQRNALTMLLAFLLIMAVACFAKLKCKHANSVAVCARKNCNIERYYGRCPNPQAFKKA